VSPLPLGAGGDESAGAADGGAPVIVVASLGGAGIGGDAVVVAAGVAAGCVAAGGADAGAPGADPGALAFVAAVL
jgi:hypothetical protein